MTSNRKKMAYAASQIANDPEAQQELRAFAFALVSAYKAARRAGRSGLVDPRIRDELGVAFARGSAAQARITPRTHRSRRSLVLLGALLATPAVIVFWRRHKQSSTITSGRPASDGTAEDVETHIHESETAVAGAADETVEELRDRIG
jgi:hypothetical protein